MHWKIHPPTQLSLVLLPKIPPGAHPELPLRAQPRAPICKVRPGSLPSMHWEISPPSEVSLRVLLKIFLRVFLRMFLEICLRMLMRIFLGGGP